MNAQVPPMDSLAGQLQKIMAECLRSVLGQMAGFPIAVELEADGPEKKQDAPERKAEVWSIFAASKALNGEMAVVSTEAGSVALAQMLMSEPINSTAPLDKNLRDAYEELLRQVFGQVSTGLRPVTGGEVEIKYSGSDPPDWPNATTLGILLTGEKFSTIRLSLVVTEKIAMSLTPPRQDTVRAAQAAPQMPPARNDVPVPRNANLELVLDVNLEATIRFGQKQMLLREILELHPGVAIALDRRIEEPVELLIGGRMVARGEVVIVDGNYGLRVTEIVSPQQRIESLRNLL